MVSTASSWWPGESSADPLRRTVARWEEFSRIGAAAREKVQRSYSVPGHAERYVSFFTRACAQNT